MCSYGDIYFAELPEIAGTSVQHGRRPVIVVSNNRNNKYSSLVTVVPLTSRITKAKLPTHVLVEGYGLSTPSLMLGEQILTIDRECLRRKVGKVDSEVDLRKIKKAILVQLNMFDMAA